MIGELSRFRLAWDSVILLLVVVSCTMIPYQFAFHQDAREPLVVLLLLMDAVFIVDIALNFVTTHRARGIDVTDRRSTAQHYLRGSFLIDLLANFPFDLLFLALGDPSIYGLSSVLLLRLLKLLRVFKIFVIFRRWEALSWINPGHLKIIKIVAIIMLLVHWIACAWFVSALIAGFPTNSWVVRADLRFAEPINQYVRSLYWTITTMTTVGYGDITPIRNAEYLVAALVMLMGASLYAFLIGSVASLLSSLNAAKSTHRERMRAVTQYLHNRRIPSELNSRVRNYYEYLWARYQGIKEGALLEDLPSSLRLEIMGHLAGDVLVTVPLFKYSSRPLMDRLLMSLELQTYPPDCLVVRENQTGNEIFFITQGMVEIVSDDGRSHGILESGDYFGHMSLVLREKRTASIRTRDYCDMLILTKAKLERIREEYPEFNEVLKKMSAERSQAISDLLMEGIVL